MGSLKILIRYVSLIIGQQSTVQIKVGIIEIPPALLTCFLAHHRLKARLLNCSLVLKSPFTYILLIVLLIVKVRSLNSI